MDRVADMKSVRREVVIVQTGILKKCTSRVHTALEKFKLMQNSKNLDKSYECAKKQVESHLAKCHRKQNRKIEQEKHREVQNLQTGRGPTKIRPQKLADI